MIAQPTRRYPDSLPMYKPLFADIREHENQGKMTGEEILAGIIANGTTGD